MRINFTHVKYIANKVGIDLNKSGKITISSGLSNIIKVVEDILNEDLQKEYSLETKVKDLMDENESDIYIHRANEKELFKLIKRKLAEQYGITLSFEERYSILAHEILDKLYEDNLINYSISDNQVKNIIYNSIEDYSHNFSNIQKNVGEKIAGYKKKLIPGTDEYNIVFEKLYEEELIKRGMI